MVSSVNLLIVSVSIFCQLLKSFSFFDSNLSNLTKHYSMCGDILLDALHFHCLWEPDAFSKLLWILYFLRANESLLWVVKFVASSIRHILFSLIFCLGHRNLNSLKLNLPQSTETVFDVLMSKIRITLLIQDL